VIKIRYADLPGGLHVRVAASGKNTIIYLLPGLTAVQRRAALRRARSTARMGQGPGLPTVGVAGAVAADGIRTTLRNIAGAMRGHPAVFVPPIVIIGAAAVVYVLLVSVTIRAHSPQSGGLGNGLTDPVPQSVAPPPQNAPQRPVTRRAGAAPAGAPRPSPRPSVAGHHSAGATPSPSAASPSPSPDPLPSATPEPAPPDSSAPSPSPAASQGTSRSGGSPLCIDVGPLGACLSM
jgi:hypothetical protein